MTFNKDMKIANRYGLDTKFYDYKEYQDYLDNKTENKTEPEALLTVEYSKLTEINYSQDTAWATGGKTNKKLIGFDKEPEATFKYSTDIITPQTIAFFAGKTLEDGDKKIVFDSLAKKDQLVTMVSDTIYKDIDGEIHKEKMTIHKARIKKTLNLKFDGSSDPQSIDVEYDILGNEKGEFIEIEFLDDNTEGTESNT